MIASGVRHRRNLRSGPNGKGLNVFLKSEKITVKKFFQLFQEIIISFINSPRSGVLNLGYAYPQGYVRGILGVRDRFLKILQF